jgi:hypothetical protein
MRLMRALKARLKHVCAVNTKYVSDESRLQRLHFDSFFPGALPRLKLKLRRLARQTASV